MTVVMDQAKWEKWGIPTVGIHYDNMLSVAKQTMLRPDVAQPYLRWVTIKKTSQDERAEEALTKVPEILAGLTKPLTKEEQFKGKYEVPKLPRIVFTGNLEEVQQFFQGDPMRYPDRVMAAEMTDGTPIMPPTESLVKRMLAGTSHRPDEVICTLPPMMGKATVEKVAINAVMAGCRPEYMPLLLAHTNAMSKIQMDYLLQGGEGSGMFSTFVCGPISKEIGLNTGAPFGDGPSPLTPGVPSNTSIGRWIRLMQLNVGGIEPGVNEGKGSGNPLKTCIVLAENNEQSPWEQYSASLGIGIKDGESSVTIFVGGSGIKGLTLSTWLLRSSKDLRPQLMGRVVGEGKRLGGFNANTLLWHCSPRDAHRLAEQGYSKDDCRRWIWEHCTDKWGVAKKSGLSPFSRYDDSVLNAIQGKTLTGNMDLLKTSDDTVVKYFHELERIQIFVCLARMSIGGIQGGHPRWTERIDKWR